MKRHYLLFVAISLICSMAHSQSDSSSSKISKLLSRKGIALEREIGKTINKKVEALYSPGSFYYRTVFIKDLGSGYKTGGINIVVWKSGFIGNEYYNYDYSAYLDYDEIDECVSFLRLLEKRVKGDAPELYTKLSYISSDFEIGAYFEPEETTTKKSKKKQIHPEWSGFIRTNNYSKDARAHFYIDDIPVLIEDFTNALDYINNKINQ